MFKEPSTKLLKYPLWLFLQRGNPFTRDFKLTGLPLPSDLVCGAKLRGVCGAKRISLCWLLNDGGGLLCRGPIPYRLWSHPRSSANPPWWASVFSFHIDPPYMSYI